MTTNRQSDAERNARIADYRRVERSRQRGERRERDAIHRDT